MKVICSEGGPLIGLDQRYMHKWSGVFGKTFAGDGSPFASDYEAVCHLVDGLNNPIRNITKFTSFFTECLLLAIPIETTVIAASPTSILIAQVEAGEEDWSFSDISSADYDKAFFDESTAFHFDAKQCTFVFFDAAYKAEDVGDDLISFNFEDGQYKVSNAVYQQGNEAELNLFKLEKLA